MKWAKLPIDKRRIRSDYPGIPPRVNAQRSMAASSAATLRPKTSLEAPHWKPSAGTPSLGPPWLETTSLEPPGWKPIRC
jgi:hypothetical protein